MRYFVVACLVRSSGLFFAPPVAQSLWNSIGISLVTCCFGRCSFGVRLVFVWPLLGVCVGVVKCLCGVCVGLVGGAFGRLIGTCLVGVRCVVGVCFSFFPVSCLRLVGCSLVRVRCVRGVCLVVCWCLVGVR